MQHIDKRAKATHMLIAVTKTHSPVKLAVFSTYDEALAAYSAVQAEAEKFPNVSFYAVREVNDPSYSKLNLVHHTDIDLFVVPRTIYKASNAFRYKELRDTAKWAVNTNPTKSLMNLEDLVKTSLKERFGYSIGSYSRDHRVYISYDYSNHEVQEAVKSLVLIGRCPRSRRAYWIPKSAKVKLSSLVCPCCKRPLSQTTMALQSTFRPYPTEMLQKEAA